MQKLTNIGKIGINKDNLILILLFVLLIILEESQEHAVSITVFKLCEV